MATQIEPVDLTGRVAFVTGAGSGLGAGFARTLAAAGARVVLAGRRAGKLEETAKAVAALGGEALVCPLDLCDAAAIPLAIEKAQSHFGLVDILVNNAGIADANYATALSLETIDQVIDTNFRAPFLLAREVARHLIKAEMPGNIVNLSSSGAFHYAPKSASALYCGLKGGIVRLTETLAIEWAKYRINVNCIAPGMFRSEMTDGFIARGGGKVMATFPRGRMGEPEALSSTLLYLVSPQSHFITGACIIADDGQMPR